MPPGGSSTVHIYTQTIYRMTQNKRYTEQHKNFVRVRAVLRLCELYPDISLTTEEKARKTLSQGGRRVPAGTTKIRYLINWRNPAEQILQNLYLETEEETLCVSNIPQKMDSVQDTDMISINICQFI